MTVREALDKGAGALGTAAVGVPGLAFLRGGLTLPDGLQGLVQAVILIVTAGVAGAVYVSRTSVGAWPARRVRRHLLGSVGLGVVMVVACFLVHREVITEYQYKRSEPPVELFVPAVVEGGRLVHPYIDCGLVLTGTCDTGPATGRKESARGVGDLKSEQGAAILIPEGPASLVWTALIVAVFALGTAALVYLAALLRVRGLDPLTGQPEPPAPEPAP